MSFIYFYLKFQGKLNGYLKDPHLNTLRYHDSEQVESPWKSYGDGYNVTLDEFNRTIVEASAKKSSDGINSIS
jgi:hypothetical protein